MLFRSLVDHEKLKYKWLAEWDRALIALLKQKNVLGAAPGKLLHIDPENKILIAERANLIFVCNFSPTKSFPGYGITPHHKATHHLLLDSDAGQYGGHARLDPATPYPIAEDGQLKFYTTSRSAIVLGSLPIG